MGNKSIKRIFNKDYFKRLQISLLNVVLTMIPIQKSPESSMQRPIYIKANLTVKQLLGNFE